MKSIGIRAALGKIGATDIEVHNGYHYQYGFFNMPGKGLMYFNTGDDRNNGRLGTMVRTAKDRKDYQGGINEWWLKDRLQEMGYTIRIGGKN